MLVLVSVGFFAPAAVLSAVAPTVVKLQLDSLNETGAIVGRPSALGTLGAIVGTFVTGFVLVAAWPTTPILVAVAVMVIAVGVMVQVVRRRNRRRARIVAAACVVAIVGALGASGVNAALDPCDREWPTTVPGSTPRGSTAPGG